MLYPVCAAWLCYTCFGNRLTTSHVQQDLDAATRESAALRAQADELRTHNMALGARSEELVRSVAHLQGVVGDFGAAAARGDKEAIAELASKVGGVIWRGRGASGHYRECHL